MGAVATAVAARSTMVENMACSLVEELGVEIPQADLLRTSVA
jgi:hypothetical protein